MKRQKEKGEKQVNRIIKIKIIELEEKLMDVIEISSNYEKLPVPVLNKK